jgi:hypothetical protein
MFSVPPVATVAAIGASAGGVEALRALFHAAQTGTGVAYIVLLHLAPDRGSALPEIIGRECALEVLAAEHDMPILADQVLVIPPGVLATVSKGRIMLQPGDTSSRDPRSIDVLFSSLALDFQERAIGVVLSGYGHDGTLGIKAIKEQGRLTVAQGSNALGPGHNGMPDSAIAGGLVDLILPVGEIAAKLAEYAASAGPLADLVQGQLAPHLASAGRGLVTGPPVTLEPAPALAMGLVLHEMATNAVKYGALSGTAGTVTVTWKLQSSPAGPRLVLRWEERGGPKAVPPTRRGFGSELVSGQVEHALRGTLKQRYGDEGYTATITMPWTRRAAA